MYFTSCVYIPLCLSYRDHEVAILSECQDGSYLFRDCISEPALITLSVRTGDTVCRYRITEELVMGIAESSMSCTDEYGNQVNLKHAVTRPKGIEPLGTDKSSAVYDAPS
eukprot:scpid87786/ scgid3958/ 